MSGFGCSEAPRSVITKLKPSENAMVTTSAETSTSLVRDGANGNYYCAPLPPDATYTESSSEALSLTFLNFGGNDPGDENLSEENSGDEMIGRTPGLLTAREILYRACELSGNHKLSSEQAIELFEKSMKTAANLVSQEVENTTISISTSMTSAHSQSQSNNNATVTPLPPPVESMQEAAPISVNKNNSSQTDSYNNASNSDNNYSSDDTSSDNTWSDDSTSDDSSSDDSSSDDNWN